MAPEVILKTNHSYQVDHFACGVIVYELMKGKRPFKVILIIIYTNNI
jgi:serine/threonine protein kinase